MTLKMVQTRRDMCVLDRIKCRYITERYNVKIPCGKSTSAYKLSMFHQRISPIVVLQRLRDSDVYHWTSGKPKMNCTDVIADRGMYGSEVGVDGIDIHTANDSSPRNIRKTRKHREIIGENTTLADTCNILSDENNDEYRTTSTTNTIVTNLTKEVGTSHAESCYVSECHDKISRAQKLNHGQHMSGKSVQSYDSQYDQPKLSAHKDATDIFPTALIRNVASDVEQRSVDAYRLSQDEMLHPHNDDPMDSFSESVNDNIIHGDMNPDSEYIIKQNNGSVKIDDEDIRQPKTKLHPTPEDHDECMKIMILKKRVHPRRMRDYRRHKKLPKMHMFVNIKETSSSSKEHASPTPTHKKYDKHDFPKRESLFSDNHDQHPGNCVQQVEGATIGNVNNTTILGRPIRIVNFEGIFCSKQFIG